MLFKLFVGFDSMGGEAFFLLLSLLPYLHIIKQIMELMLVQLQGASQECPPVVSWPV